MEHTSRGRRKVAALKRESWGGWTRRPPTAPPHARRTSASSAAASDGGRCRCTELTHEWGSQSGAPCQMHAT